MSSALERLGRFAARARRPWMVIGSWVAIGFLVITSASAFGQDLEDPFEAPGLDSHRATELLAQAARPRWGSVRTSSSPLRAPRRASSTPRPRGADVARFQYPERQHLEPDDLANVVGAHEAPGEGRALRRLVPAHRRSHQGPHRPRHLWAPTALRAAGRLFGLPHRRGRAQHGPAPAVMTSPGDEKGDHNHDHLPPTT